MLAIYDKEFRATVYIMHINTYPLTYPLTYQYTNIHTLLTYIGIQVGVYVDMWVSMLVLKYVCMYVQYMCVCKWGKQFTTNPLEHPKQNIHS